MEGMYMNDPSVLGCMNDLSVIQLFYGYQWWLGRDIGANIEKVSLEKKIAQKLKNSKGSGNTRLWMLYVVNEEKTIGESQHRSNV